MYTRLNVSSQENSCGYISFLANRDCAIKTCVECVMIELLSSHARKHFISNVFFFSSRELYAKHPQRIRSLTGEDTLIMRNLSEKFDNEIYGRYLGNHRYRKFRSRKPSLLWQSLVDRWSGYKFMAEVLWICAKNVKNITIDCSAVVVNNHT